MSQRASLRHAIQTLRRWQGSRLQRVAEWEYISAYWKLRQKRLNADVRLGSYYFRIKEYFRSRRESATAQRILFSAALKPVFLAVAIICLLEFVEHSILLYGSHLWQFIPDKVRQWVSGIDQIINRNTDTYVTFFATFAQIAGAFLALYFTAVSVVVSTVYARVQGDVRSVVLRDKVSNAYVSLVAMLGVVSTLLVAALALGRLPSVLSLIFAALLGVASFYSFVELGWRVFNFFDPTRLVGYLTSDIVRWVHSATSRGYRWQNESFQAHYQKQADAVLTTYRNIVLLANREEHLQSDALVGLAQRAFSLLSFYGNEKSRIPSDSRWFRQTHRHKSWFKTSMTETFTALNTGTSLRPELVPDLMWFESEIEETVAYTLEKLLSRKDLQSVYSFSDAAQRSLYALAGNFAVDEALHLFRTLAPPLRGQSHASELTGAKTEDDLLKSNIALGLTDIHALGFIQILLGLSNRLENLTVESLTEIVANVKWHKPESIYETGLPRGVIEQIEILRKHLDFERRVEGQLITPLWYRQQVVAIAFIRFIERTCNELLAEFEKAMADEAESLVKEKRSIFAAQLIERGLEGCNKFAYHFDAMQKYVEALSKLRKVEDRPCPTIDWESHARRIVKVRERLLTALAHATLALASLPKTTKMPDYFGHAYAYISDECYRTLAEGDKARFSKLFPIFFHAGLTACDHLMSAPIAVDPSMNFGFSAQPIIDVVDISGFAYLFTELDSNNFREVVDKVWDSYLDAIPNKEAMAQLLCLSVTHKESLFGTFPRDNMQEAWVQDFERRLRRLGLLEMPLYDFGFENDRK
ncbi:MAG: hypothetical protein QOD32_2435, partial [Pyrinomonadaceae bacterium]|nr:hypothetical protein [Pyrinomonadaceae bacterium]